MRRAVIVVAAAFVIVVAMSLLVHFGQRNNSVLGRQTPSHTLAPNATVAITTTTQPPIVQTTVIDQQRIADDHAAVAQGQANVQFFENQLRANQSLAQSWADTCSQDQQATQQASSTSSLAELQSQENVDCSTAATDQASVDKIQAQLQQAQSDLQLTLNQLQQDEQG
jgi:hypothetical protein